MHTVGILGINGNVGKPTAKLLVEAAEQGKIKLIIFHREGKSGDFKDGKNVELRVIDLDGPEKDVQEAIKGVNVFVSTVGVAGLASEVAAVKALAKSPDFVTYIPATYSTTWNEEDFADPVLQPILNMMPGWKTAKEMGLAMTKVYTGVFDFTFFEQGFLYAPLKENSMWANEKMLKNPLPITTMTHLAKSITTIVTTSPTTIKNKEFSIISFWATGSQIRDVYTKLHGKPTQVRDWTKEDREAQRADLATFGSVKVGYADKWEGGSWEYESGGRVLVGGYEGSGLEGVVRQFM